MIPSSSQVLLLTAMGIPVWKLRSMSEKNAELAASNLVDGSALLSKFSSAKILVCHDSQITKQKNYLLQAMMSTIGLPGEAICFISLVELDVLTKLKEIETIQKVLLLMGDGAVKQVFGDESKVETYRNNTHNIEELKLTAIVSFGLDELMLNPQNKALALQDLHTVKMCTQQYVS